MAGSAQPCYKRRWQDDRAALERLDAALFVTLVNHPVVFRNAAAVCRLIRQLVRRPRPTPDRTSAYPAQIEGAALTPAGPFALSGHCRNPALHLHRRAPSAR